MACAAVAAAGCIPSLQIAKPLQCCGRSAMGQGTYVHILGLGDITLWLRLRLVALYTVVQVCIYICIYIYVCIYTYIYRYVYIYYIYTYLLLHIYILIYLYTIYSVCIYILRERDCIDDTVLNPQRTSYVYSGNIENHGQIQQELGQCLIHALDDHPYMCFSSKPLLFS